MFVICSFFTTKTVSNSPLHLGSYFYAVCRSEQVHATNILSIICYTLVNCVRVLRSGDTGTFSSLMKHCKVCKCWMMVIGHAEQDHVGEGIRAGPCGGGYKGRTMWGRV